MRDPNLFHIWLQWLRELEGYYEPVRDLDEKKPYTGRRDQDKKPRTYPLGSHGPENQYGITSKGQTMTEYVAGFMVDGQGKVALVRKNRPAWQFGRYNGIGGHIEPGELPASAMVREFQEETGYETTVTQWWPFATLKGEDWKVYFFMTRGELNKVNTMTDEEIVVVPISDVTVHNSIPNLTWLIPMGLTVPHERAYAFHVTEEG